MDKYRSNVSSILPRISFIGLVIISLTVFFFLTKSAEMQSSSVSSDSVLPEQNLVLGKLAFTTVTGTFSGPIPGMATANADGTGYAGVASFPPSPIDPAWSPDGTKIVYSANGDILVINADGTNPTNLTNTSGINEFNPSWSITGKIIYERSSQIWIMNADGSNQMQFAGITQPSPAAPVWSADGGKIAFASGGEIWKINADGTNEQRVTTNATTDADPSWSPDGAKIVFGKGGSGIAVVNTDGTNELNLTNVSGDVKPAWSPDGTTIAFVRGASPSGIYLMDVNGGNQVRVIANTSGTFGVSHNDPAWQSVAQTPNTFTISGRITRANESLGGVTVNLIGTTNAAATTDAAGNYQFSGLAPGGSYTISPSFLNHFFTPPNRSFSNIDGNKIADFSALRVCAGFVCAQNGKIAFVSNGEIFTINSDGTNQANITNNAASDSSPNYSPDGSNIIFSTTRDGNSEIYRMNADGSNPVRLTNNTASDTSPYYSLDGSTIVFVSDRDGNNEIYKMNADGSNQVRLTNNTSSDAQPAFSPDGQKIVFVNIPPFPLARKLFTINADGSNLLSFPDSNSPFALYERPSYSPDGSKIIFTYTSDAQSQPRLTWTMNLDGTNRAQFPGGGGLSASYSPDGTKITYNCCTFDNTYRLRTANVTGGSEQSLTPNGFPPNSPDLPDWQPLAVTRRGVFDFDGDGRSDISVFRQTDRIWYLLRSRAGIAGYQWGLSDDKLAPADYDGDLKTDIAVWRSSDGNFYVLNSFDNTVRIESFGLKGDIPTGGDFDGDGKADLAIYRGGAQGVFYYRASMGNPSGNITVIPWGITDDKPVAGDYDGDGRTDAAVYRPSSGVWYVRKSSDGQMLANAFGLAGDTLVPADYDADGKTDLAVYRGGVWYIWRSSQGITIFQYGLSSDTPAPADYDGDGRADAAIYRDGAWWILKTQSGATEITNFGISGDKPIPAAYVR
ncbi:MAG: FG-GAP-like repeat-containing protein [Pyrinomonadaceae bacterium]